MPKNIFGILGATAVVAVAAGFGAGFGVGWASKDSGSEASGGEFSGAVTSAQCPSYAPRMTTTKPTGGARYIVITDPSTGKTYYCTR